MQGRGRFLRLVSFQCAQHYRPCPQTPPDRDCVRQHQSQTPTNHDSFLWPRNLTKHAKFGDHRISRKLLPKGCFPRMVPWQHLRWARWMNCGEGPGTGERRRMWSPSPAPPCPLSLNGAGEGVPFGRPSLFGTPQHHRRFIPSGNTTDQPQCSAAHRSKPPRVTPSPAPPRPLSPNGAGEGRGEGQDPIPHSGAFMLSGHARDPLTPTP
jgi:hypothetical protein